MRTALVINPTSGRGRGTHVGRRTLTALRHAGDEVLQAWGPDVETTVERLEHAVGSGVDRVVAVGGDGLIHLALQQVAARDLPLGIVPAGTGNDVARAAGISLDPGVALARLLGGGEQVIDAARVGPRWYLAVMACGFDALVNERANTMTFPPGRAKYVSAMLSELRVFKPQRFTLDLDDRIVSGPMMLVAVGNTASYGGGMRVCPDAVIDDGLLDVTVVHEISRPEFVKVFPSVYAGTHIHHPAVETFRARRVALAADGALAYADGERIGPLPQTVEVIPRAVRLIGRP